MPLKQKPLDENEDEADFVDKGIVNLEEIPRLCESTLIDLRHRAGGPAAVVVRRRPSVRVRLLAPLSVSLPFEPFMERPYL